MRDQYVHLGEEHTAAAASKLDRSVTHDDDAAVVLLLKQSQNTTNKRLIDLAGVAELADAADLKSAGRRLSGFESQPRHFIESVTCGDRLARVIRFHRNGCLASRHAYGDMHGRIAGAEPLAQNPAGYCCRHGQKHPKERPMLSIQLLVVSRPAVLNRLLAALFVVLMLPGSLTAQMLKLSDATIADINEAFDVGTLTSEALLQQYLARIAAYDQQGPELNAVLSLNVDALDTARALDRERQDRGPRSLLHGVPVLLKDNVDTHDLPTTAGSVLLAGSIPPNDAFIVQRLRAAGAIILAKVNMSEFASGVPMSSIGGYTLNPHSLTRTPSGSSGGTGVAIAAVFGQIGIGTDTGGSVRGPSTANGIVGLKTTHGLLSRDGIVPLGLTFDTAGPMARHVYDIAVMLSAMTGVDPADESTRKSDGKVPANYTPALDVAALDGARIGVARDFLGQDGEVDWIIEASLQAMRNAGVEVVDVKFPTWLLEARGDMYTTIRWREFRVQIAEYLNTLGEEYPKTLAELIERSQRIIASTTHGAQPNPTRWALMQREEESGEVTDSEYRAVRDHGLALVRAIVEGVLEESELDAIVYPTRPIRPSLVEGSTGAGGRSVTNIANLTGFPDLSVPAGFTSNRLPVNISFLGKAFAEERLLAIGYAFEQLTKARRDPLHTPVLPGEGIEQQ